MGLNTLIHSTPHFAEAWVQAYLFISLESSLESMKGETTRTDLEKTEEATDLKQSSTQFPATSEISLKESKAF